MFEITAILNLHNEGRVCYPTLKSFFLTVDFARKESVATEAIIVLDRGDDDTKEILQQFSHHKFTILETNLGDLGLARNAGVQSANSNIVAFLDGDDLWSQDWLYQLAKYDWPSHKEIILHPEFNIFFESDDHIFIHRDMEDPEFNLGFLFFENYWTALSAGKRDTYLKYPYRNNQLKLGMGFEDWSWNVELIQQGIIHKVVPGSTHYIRRKPTSLLKDTVARGCIPTISLDYDHFINNII